MPVQARRVRREPEAAGDRPDEHPETLLLAGMPISDIQSPAESYMPHVVMTLSAWRLEATESTRSPVIGWRPPVASVAAMTARSRVVTSTEHCRM